MEPFNVEPKTADVADAKTVDTNDVLPISAGNAMFPLSIIVPKAEIAPVVIHRQTDDDGKQDVPFYLEYIFDVKRADSDHYEYDDDDDNVRENWETQLEYLLSCIGYVIGFGNLVRFPAKVYNGGGGSFLIPYFSFCLLFGGPLIMMELCLGQFCGQGCSKAFEFCPVASGLGWTISLMAYIVLINYTIVISCCARYFFMSFRFILPWSVCTHKYNTPACLNTSTNASNLANKSFYESSTVQFYNFQIVGDQRADGTFYKITEPFGPVNKSMMAFLFVVSVFTGLTIMFGLRISAKIIYIAVVFLFIGILQFLILGCNLPGALNGIKFYLYPNPKRMTDPYVYQSALEQVLYSSGIGVGALITISSFNRFRDKIYRNVLILMWTDIVTCFLSGFATFPVLGYIAHRSGKKIENVLHADSNVFFMTYPEALSTIASPNLWSILFMFMALASGTVSLFVLLKTVTMAISDFWPILTTKRNKKIFTMSMCFLTFALTTILSLPGGQNWLAILEDKVTPFVLTVTVILEVFTIFGIYGIKKFQHDVELMTGQKLGIYWIFCLCFMVPIGATIILVFIAKSTKPINRNDFDFPSWTLSVAWIANAIILSPIFFKAILILVKYKLNNPNLSVREYLKLCINPSPQWGPREKRHWVESVLYAKKLLKYKDNPIFLASLRKNEKIGKLVHQARMELQ